MSKKISVWLTVMLVIAASVITFQMTVIFASGKGYAVNLNDRFKPAQSEKTEETAEPSHSTDEVGTGDTSEPPKTEEEEVKKEYTADEIREAVTRKLDTILAYYDRYYIGELELDDILDGVAEGLVAYSGDRYAQYHPAEEYQTVTSGYSGEFAGIGVSVIYNSDYGAIEILNVMPDSPALEAGLLPDDLIIAVEGESVLTLGYNAAVDKIRGEIGTEVKLTIARGENYEEQLEKVLVRRKVEEQSITYEEIEISSLKNPVAYIRITDFNATTAAQFKDAVNNGRSNQVHGFIFDLRNNGGGTLDSVVEMLDFILPEGPIVRIQYKDGREEVIGSKASCVDEPIVVLVNGNTASAAELFTSALRDYGKATPVIGNTTFGKGTVQSIMPLGDGSALRLSTSLYCPPFSDNFEGVGIVPDIEVSLADEYKYVNLYKLDRENDAQLQAAIDIFK